MKRYTTSQLDSRYARVGWSEKRMSELCRSYGCTASQKLQAHWSTSDKRITWL